MYVGMQDSTYLGTPFLMCSLHILEISESKIQSIAWIGNFAKSETNSIRRIANFQGNLMRRTQHRKTCIHAYEVFPGKYGEKRKKIEKKKSKDSMHNAHPARTPKKDGLKGFKSTAGYVRWMYDLGDEAQCCLTSPSASSQLHRSSHASCPPAVQSTSHAPGSNPDADGWCDTGSAGSGQVRHGCIPWWRHPEHAVVQWILCPSRQSN